MICPKCNNALSQQKYYDIFIDLCNSCGGIWFDQGELKEYITDLLIAKQDIPTEKFTMEPKPVVGEIKIQEPAKICPKCRTPLKSFNYCYDSNVILDKCPACNGLWTDGGEIEKIAQYHKGNPHMDGIGTGLAGQVQYHDKIKEISETWRNYRGNWYWYFPW